MTLPRPGLDVEIDYRRAMGDAVVYRQRLVEARPAVVVTLMEATPLPEPKQVGERVVLEPGSPVVWFTFPDAWHDIGAFHLADGTFTGWYANILTPVELDPPTPERWHWSTMDLCLDIWVDAAGVDEHAVGSEGDNGARGDVGAAQVLDRDELADALTTGALAPDRVARAEQEAERLLDLARNKQWPPAVVSEWPLERARRVVRRSAGQPSASPSASPSTR